MMKNLWMSFIAVLLSTVLVACDSSSDSTPAQQNVNHSTNHVIQIETN